MRSSMPYETAMIRPRPWPVFLLLAALGTCAGQPVAGGETSPGVPASPDWVQDVLVVAMPAAAVGGCQAGIYTPAVNGVRPWRQALIRWLTGRAVMGN